MTDVYDIKVNREDVQVAFTALKNASIGVAEPLKTIGRTIVTSNIPLQFRNESDPYGLRWKALSKKTQARRRKGKRKNKRNKILRDTGHLAKSFTFQARKNTLLIGTNVEYAAHHQFGTGDIPQRAMLPTEDGGMPDTWAEVMLDAFNKHFIESVKGFLKQ